MSDDDAVQRAAAGPEQAGGSRRYEEELTGRVRQTLTLCNLNLQTYQSLKTSQGD